MKIANFKFQVLDFIRHPLFSGSAVMIIGSNSVNVLNYFYHLIMGRLLGPSGYGELVSLVSVIGLLGVIPGSINLAITKYVSSAKNKNEVDNLVSWLRIKIFQTSVVAFVIIMLLIPIISSFLHINNISYLILISIAYLFVLPSGLNRSILQGLLKFKETVSSVLVENTIKLLFSISLIYLGFYLFGAMVALVISAVIGWYLTHYYLRVHIIHNPQRPSKIKEMILFILPVMIQSVSTTSLYTSDFILVKHFFTSSDSGIYASLSTLGKIIFFASGPIGTVMFPLIVQRSVKGQDYKKIFKYSFTITTVMSLGVLLIYWLFPDAAIKLLYGSAYLGASKLLVLFGVFITLFTLSSLLINFNLSLGRIRVVLFSLVASICQVLLIWLFHKDLFTVILISITITALLLLILLIYSMCGKKEASGGKSSIINSSGL